MAPPGAQAVTLSLRISGALRDRLEQIRELRSRRKGQSVTTSEVAKELLESTREDQLEEVRLFANPTETLLKTRHKGESGLPLSRAEWIVLAHFLQRGLEAFGSKPVSRGSLTTILRAFQAAYELRTKDASDQESHYYLYNLPSLARGNEKLEAITPEVVRRAVAQTLRMSTAGEEWAPVFVGRNLYVLLDRERLSSIDELNQALKPFWPALWRVAARGHYYVKGQPIRDKSKRDEYICQPAITPIEEGPEKAREESEKYTLSFAFGEDNELSLLLGFPERRETMYPLGSYPKIAEFRTMLTTLEPRYVEMDGRLLQHGHWQGEYFYGYITERKKQNKYWLRARENGITVSFTEEEWGSVRRLFDRAWEIPEVKRQWDILSLEYGEL
jgi:hypothetical protein